MASLLYNAYKTGLFNGAFNFASDTIKLALTTSSYTPDQDAHDYFDDVTNEVTSTNYTAGGATLASKTITQDNTNNRTDFDAADTAWVNVTLTTRYGVLYKSTGTAATSPLICLFDWGSDQTMAGQDFTVQWNSSGILRIS